MKIEHISIYKFRFDLEKTESITNPKYHSYHRILLVKDYCLKIFFRVCLNCKLEFSFSPLRGSSCFALTHIGWAPKNWCFWTVVLEKALESPLDCKEIKPVNPKENQSWIFVGRTDAEAEVPILWLPDAKSWLIEKDPKAGKGRRQEKGTTDDEIEMIAWPHQLNRHEFEQDLGDGEGQGILACCNP